MKLVLTPHKSSLVIASRVSGEVHRRGDLIDWHMRVERSRPFVVNPSYGADPRKNWELWNWDVVEAFLQLRSAPEDFTAPYLELQVSPLNQALALVIRKPRVSVYTPLALVFKSHVETDADGYSMRAQVRLPSELQGVELWGGLFACLGQSPREYWALGPNPEANPDFHRPELFERLD